MPTTKQPSLEFGLVYYDRISGFEGACTGKASYISGCDQVLLTPTIDENGGYREGVWFDDDRLIERGPQRTPPRRT